MDFFLNQQRVAKLPALIMTTETKSPDLRLTIKSTDEWVKVQRYGRYVLTVSRNTQNPAEMVLLDLIELLTHKTEDKDENHF